MRYEFYYWASIQGRGEFVRLALEEAGADYVDVARQPGGEAEMMRLVDAEEIARPSFAPPFLKAGALLIGQTANVLLYLGAHHGLAPVAEAGRLWAHQLQLTIADLVDEAHDTHHPLSSGLYYEDQKDAARQRSQHFRKERMPKYLGYFERILRGGGESGEGLAGEALTYADLSLFQAVRGLQYAFPKAWASLAPKLPATLALVERVERQPNIAAYLKSERRIPFNQEGVFRHYPELDGAA